MNTQHLTIRSCRNALIPGCRHALAPAMVLWRRNRVSTTVAAAIAVILTQHPARADDAESTTALQEITVTATRRSEDINKVPMNITAYDQTTMDDQGVRQIDDLARLTPDLQFTHTTGAAGNNSTDIAIRGVFSDVGAATTGIYIDDTPIQLRNIGYWNANAFPQIFDLERVEVLRGPQGTLFGAGAEGGAVRFITPDPGLQSYSAYARADAADTLGGDPSFEAGAALGGPLLEDRLGFRISAWGRQDGGYINRVSPDNGATVDGSSNYQQSGVLRTAFTAVPVDQLKITASILYQNVYVHDRTQYWSTLSDPYSDSLEQAARLRQPISDNFYLPALKVQYDLDKVSFGSNTSYYDHHNEATLDYTTYFGAIFDGKPLQYLTGDTPSLAYVTDGQHTFTQEVRAQSADTKAFISWTVGLFYSDTTQNDVDLTTDGQAVYTRANGNLLSFTQYTTARDKQFAGYVDVGISVTDALKVSAGVRLSDDKFTFEQAGTYNGFTLTPVTGSQSDRPVTPKGTVSYQLDADNFLYVTAAKGYRQGGVNGSVPAALCASDLGALGLATTPTAYTPDSLWSFEAGSKNSLFGGRLGLDSSVYLIKWTNIQESVRLPSCGFSYVGNLGAATGVGGDMTVRGKLTQDWTAGFSGGYVDLTYDRSVFEGASAILVDKGDRIGGAPLHVSVFSNYNFAVLGYPGFYRIDYTFQSGTPAEDPRTFGYDGTLPLPGYLQTLSMRLGIKLENWRVSLYGNNLTKEGRPFAISHDIPGVEPLYLEGYRPLTVGLTAEYRY